MLAIWHKLDTDSMFLVRQLLLKWQPAPVGWNTPHKLVVLVRPLHRRNGQQNRLRQSNGLRIGIEDFLPEIHTGWIGQWGPRSWTLVAHAKLTFHELVILLDTVVTHPREGAAATGGELRQVVNVQIVRCVIFAEDASTLPTVVPSLEKIEVLVAGAKPTFSNGLVLEPVLSRWRSPKNMLILPLAQGVGPGLQQTRLDGFIWIHQIRWPDRLHRRRSFPKWQNRIQKRPAIIAWIWIQTVGCDRPNVFVVISCSAKNCGHVPWTSKPLDLLEFLIWQRASGRRTRRLVLNGNFPIAEVHIMGWNHWVPRDAASAYGMFDVSERLESVDWNCLGNALARRLWRSCVQSGESATVLRIFVIDAVWATIDVGGGVVSVVVQDKPLHSHGWIFQAVSLILVKQKLRIGLFRQ